jgi:hypothetical protein
VTGGVRAACGASGKWFENGLFVQQIFRESGNEEFRVQDYRVYVIGPDGHIIDRIDLVCAAEEDAIERARQVIDHHVIELWQGSRRIERFEPRQ